MKAKVIIVSGSRETEEVLNRIVHKVSSETSIKAYPNVDFGAVFFPVDQHDLTFLKRILKDKGFYFKVEDAE
ncbi:MAG: DNA-directed RNA polymerase subunit beta [Bacteroidaceae bacterium]|nr:DNA-directed RNA polymerase subunit beta [Bacteroidaceae bacterium]